MWVASALSTIVLRTFPLPIRSNAPGGRPRTWSSVLFFMFLDMRNAALCEHMSAAMYVAMDSTVNARAIHPLCTIPDADSKSG